jgi:thiol-disulfide isomerase/thioredoxin
MFLFCFADWCPHCKLTLPDWLDFESDTANRTNILVSSVNCTAEATLCETFGIVRFPTFLLRWSSLFLPIKIFASTFSYWEVIERIDRLENGTFIANLTEPPATFPSIVFRLSPNDSEGVGIATNAIVRARFLESRFVFFDFNASVANREAVIFPAEYAPVVMNASFTEANIAQFIVNYNFAMLAAWTLPTLKPLTGLFASVFVSSWTEVQAYHALANATRALFPWGRAVSWTEQSLSRFGLTLNDLPAIIVLDPVGDRYFPFPNATDLTRAGQWLKTFEGDLEDLPYEPLFLRTRPRPTPTPFPAPTPAQTAPMTPSRSIRWTELKRPTRTAKPRAADRWKLALVAFFGGMAITAPIAGFIAYRFLRGSSAPNSKAKVD